MVIGNKHQTVIGKRNALPIPVATVVIKIRLLSNSPRLAGQSVIPVFVLASAYNSSRKYSPQITQPSFPSQMFCLILSQVVIRKVLAGKQIEVNTIQPILDSGFRQEYRDRQYLTMTVPVNRRSFDIGIILTQNMALHVGMICASSVGYPFRIKNSERIHLIRAAFLAAMVGGNRKI